MLKSMLLSSSRPFYAPPDDTAAGGGADDETVAGGAGDDTVAAGEGDDTVAAGDGDDTLEAGAGDDTVAGGEGDDTVAAGAKEDWRDKQIRKMTARQRQAERERDEARAEAETTRKLLERRGGGAADTTAGGAGDDTVAAGLSEEEVDKRAEAKVLKNQYDKDCNEAAQNGKKLYGKTWDGAMENLKTLGGFDFDTMQGILATDNPSAVLHELGSKPEEYQRIMELPPAKRLAEMVKIALPKAKVPKGVSQAAAPVAAVRGRAPADTELKDSLSDEEWATRRRAQRAARFQQRNGGTRVA